MEESSFHIKLMNQPTVGERQGQHCANGGGLDDGAENLIKVNAKSLSETPKNPASFVSLKGAISMELVLEYPLVGDDIGTRRA